MNEKEMMFQLLEGETLGKEIMFRYTNYEKLKVAIPYMIAVLVRASEDKKLTTELFVTMSKIYEELLNTNVKHEYDCSSEVANYGLHNADHTIEDIPYYSKKQLDEVRADTMKTDKLILENAIEEAYRELHNGVCSVNELAFGTRILESIRKMCKADYELCNSPKGYYTKMEREKKVKTDTAKEILDFFEKWTAWFEGSNKEINEYFFEKEKLCKKYNYEI